jgi:hypothetical protein
MGRAAVASPDERWRLALGPRRARGRRRPTGGIGAVLGALAGLSQLHPSFMAFEPLGPGRYWIFGAWLPFFALNILGEEFVWRAYMLPRQEVAFGGKAWLVNAALWLLFHAAFPWQVLVTCADHVDPALRGQRRAHGPGSLSTAGSGSASALASDLPKSPHRTEPSAAERVVRPPALEVVTACRPGLTNVGTERDVRRQHTVHDRQCSHSHQVPHGPQRWSDASPAFAAVRVTASGCWWRGQLSQRPLADGRRRAGTAPSSR